MVIRLIGLPDDAPQIGCSFIANYFVINKFTALKSGTIDTIRMKFGAVSQVKVAIYADNAGEPGALLNAVNVAQDVVAGWNDITITDTPITVGTAYWLAAIWSTDYGCGGPAYGIQRWKGATFAGFTFPDPAGLGFITDTDEMLIAGYGTWAGKISGVTNPAKVMGVSASNIATMKGVT